MSAVTAVPIRPLARGSMLKLWLALIMLCVAGGALAWAGTSHVQRTRTASGLQYQVIREGEGELVTANDAIRIHLVGRRENGEIFASTLNAQPEETTPDSFIPGFGEALKLMRKGSRYRVWIPPHLGYQGNPPPTAPFGPNETLTFDIQVVDVAPGAAQMLQMQQLQQMQQMQQMRGGGPGGPGGPGGLGAPSGPHGEAPPEPGPSGPGGPPPGR
jgi:FKBP-type peptidyl-prolyl cis-trans isomerase FkpA